MGALKHIDHEAIESGQSEAERLAKRGLVIGILIEAILRPLTKVRPIGRFLSRTIGGLQGAYIAAIERDQFDKAAAIAIYALEKYRHRKIWILDFMRHHHWWQFMSLAVQSLERHTDEAKQDKVVEMAESGLLPFEGFDVAYSFLAFSRWRYARGETDDALRFAKIAAEADETWGEADLLLGWYCIALECGDPEPHLSRALAKDRRLAEKINTSEDFKAVPGLLDSLCLDPPLH